MEKRIRGAPAATNAELTTALLSPSDATGENRKVTPKTTIPMPSNAKMSPIKYSG